MKVNRLLEMITLLLNRGTITAREFAERFEVSTRTIYRDVEDISSAGVPIYMSKGKGGGISLFEDYTLDKTFISKDETDSLLMAVRTLQATQYPDIDRFLAKLEGLFRNSASSQWVQVEFSPWGSKPDEDEKFNHIKQAILGRREIHFNYVNASGEKTLRRVCPLQIIFKSQAWYLWGFCYERDDYRTFRLSRIKNLDVTPKIFNPIELPIDKPENEEDRKKTYLTVRLKFKPEVIHRVYDDFDDALIVKKPDGTCEVSVTLVEDEWLYGFILSYGCFAEVVEPETIRKVIASRLQKAIDQYL